MTKKKETLISTSHKQKKIGSIGIAYLTVKVKTMQYLEENAVEHFHNHGTGNNSLNRTQKTIMKNQKNG